MNAFVADRQGHLYFGSDDGVLVTDASGTAVRRLSSGLVPDLALSRDGKRLYAAQFDRGLITGSSQLTV